MNFTGRPAVGQLLGQFLLAEGVLSSQQLERAIIEANASGTLLGQTLIRLGWVTSYQILLALAQQAGIEVVDLDTTPIDAALARSFPESFLRSHSLLPLRRDGSTLTAATSDIANLAGVDELRRHANLFVTLVAAREEQILKQLDRVFGGASEPTAVVGADWPRSVKIAPSLPPEAVEPELQSAARILDDLLAKAVHDGVTDVHIEPTETDVGTRFRYDGLLRPGPSFPRSLCSSLLTRTKILANLNIAENRLPQDGRILHQIGDRRLDLRVSVFPTIHGEKVAIRVLDRNRNFGLETLGLAPHDLTRLRRCITRPYGLILTTGPTGAGKTTTLYSALMEIDAVEKNIVTLEDPVEYELPAIRQTQINPRAGLTFAAGLRALLRQDPDVMLVGEMRDLETVEIAIRAAMTGHLVLSTLHTNDALGAIPRLMDMGVAPYLLASSLLGVLAQRLVRMICPLCKVSITPAEAGAERLGETASLLTAVFVGKGCASCRGTGYRGRTGIFEFLTVDPELLRATAARADADTLRRLALERQCLVPMLHEAVAKVNSGTTTVDEIVRAVFSEVSA